MNIFNTLSISATGLSAERLRMDTISSNIANVNTTRTDEGGPYRRKIVIFKEIMNARLGENGIKGVEVAEIAEDTSPLKKVFDPNHPDANEDGFVLMPNVEILDEMANLIITTRSYEANVTALNAGKSMFLKALEIGRG